MAVPQSLLQNLVANAQLQQQESLRSRKMRELAQAAPRGQAARIAAPRPIVQPPSRGMGQGLSALGKALGDIGQMKKERAAKDALSALYAPPPMSEEDLMEGVEPSAPQVTSTMLQRVLAQHPGTTVAKQGMDMVNLLARQEQNEFMNELRRDELAAREAQDLRQIEANKELKRMQLDYEGRKRFKPAGPLDYREQGIDPRDYRLSMNKFGESKIQYMPSYERRAQLKQLGVPRPEPRFEDAFSKKMGTVGADYIVETRKGGNAARTTLSNNRRIINLLDQGFTPGMLAQTNMTVGKFARLINAPESLLKKLGIMDMDQIAKGETFANIAAGFVFDALQNFTGAISEGEREYVESVVPTLAMTPGGIRAIVKIKSAIAKRAILKEKMLAEWQQKRFIEGKPPSPETRNAAGQTFDDFYKQEIDRMGNVISDDLRKEIDAASRATPTDMKFEQVTIGEGENQKTYQIIGGRPFEVGEN
tara:strand:+ start:354 stop:1784 length:1431 start_codon:yes stop_codon:yes gene_type:complete